MKRLAVLLCLLASAASAQTVPYAPILQGQVWTPTQWNSAWASKTDYATTQWQSVSFATGSGLVNLCQSGWGENLLATIPSGNAVTDFGACPSGLHRLIKNVGTTTIGIVQDGTHIAGFQPIGSTGGGSGYSNVLPVRVGETVDVVSLGSDQWQIVNYSAQSMYNYGYIYGAGGYSDSPPLAYWGVGPIAGGNATNNIPVCALCVFPLPSVNKIYTGGIRLSFPGDTPQIGFQPCDMNSTDGSCKPWTNAPYEGAHFFSQPVMSLGGGITGTPNNGTAGWVGFGGSPSYAFQGYSSDLEFPILQNPTLSGTGGAIVMAVTPNNYGTHFLRETVSNIGNGVFGGQAAFEACGATYPYSAPTTISGISPCLDWDYTLNGWANVSIIATNYANSTDHNNAALAIRQYGAHGEGVDWGMTAGTGVDLMTVHSSTRTVVEHYDPATSQITRAAQSAFSAYKTTGASNATGDGTDYTVVLDSVRFDRNTNFNTGTSTFTAPATGIYACTYDIVMSGYASASYTAAQAFLKDNSGNLYGLTQGIPKENSGGVATIMGSSLITLGATATMQLHLQVSGGSKVVGFNGGNGATTLSCYLVE
jgi:hypothetical protein